MDTKELNGALERVERRLFLRRGGLFTLGATAALALAALGRALAMKSNTSEAEDITILNVALSLEHQAIAAYQVGAESGLLQKRCLTSRCSSRAITRRMPTSSPQPSANSAASRRRR